MNEFPPIKDTPNFTPPAVDAGWPVAVWIVLGLLAGLLVVGMLVMWANRHGRIAFPPPALPVSGQSLALQLLEDLRPHAAALPPQELAARVVEIVRTFLHRQFGVMARYKTAQEILAIRRDPSVPPAAPAVREFEDLLLRAEALNYGGGSIAERHGLLIDEAVAVVRRSMDHLNAKGAPPVAAPVPPPPVEPVSNQPSSANAGLV